MHLRFWNPCLLHSRSGACYLQHIVFVTGFIFSNIIIIVQFMMSANIRVRFGLHIVLVCLYSLYHLIIIIVQNYLKALNL